MVTTFATKADCRAALALILDAIERLPVAGTDVLGRALDAYSTLRAAVDAVAICEPTLAVGTHRVRELRGLPPIAAEMNR